MKVQDLPHGEAFLFSLSAPVGELPTPLPRVGQEVALHFPGQTDEIQLRWGKTITPAVGADAGSIRTLKMLIAQDPPRILWTSQVRTGPSALLISGHRFARRIRMPEGLTFGVDEQILKRLEKLKGRALTMEQACAWLAAQALLPRLTNKSLPRFIATGDPEGGRAFRILGQQVAIDVLIEGDVARVKSISPHRPRGQGFRPPEFLMEADLTFQDGTVAGGMRSAIRLQLQQLVDDAGGSYFKLWQRYQDLERQQLMQAAREVGALTYKHFKYKASGALRFTARELRDVHRFMDALPPGDVQLEAGEDLPAELRGAEGIPEEARATKSAFVGTLRDTRWASGELDLTPLNEDRDLTPPDAGFLYLSLGGDRARLGRREAAIQSLKAADARMPQLALIIEGQPAPQVRADRVKPLSEASRACFSTAPTPRQREALDIALNTPDIALIQGPPGTGKTTVIAALQARIAELEESGSEPSGQMLLTSFQHDAVDNAVARTRVFGLPPARFGGRQGKDNAGDQADRFAEEQITQLRAQLGARQEDRPLSRYRHLRDRVAHLAAGDGDPAEAMAVLDEVLALPAEALTRPLWERARALRGTLRRRPGPGAEQALAERAARGIRTEPVSFGDDGPVRARRALDALRDALSDEEAEGLRRVGEWEEREPLPDLEALAALRDRLLDHLKAEASAALPPGPDLEILRCLRDIVTHTRGAMERSPGGVGDALEELADALKENPAEVRKTLRHYSTVFAATCQQSVGKAITQGKGLSAAFSFRTVIVDEAARANPLDLFIPLSVAQRRVSLVGDHRQLPHLLEPNIERQLSEDPDEAMARALKESLFQRLFEDLKAREHEDGVTRVVTLDQQFRMHPTLGAFVSDTFYAPFREAFESPRPASDFHHPLGAWSRGGRPLSAGWKDLPYALGQEQKAGTSWKRAEEARWIAEHVAELLQGDGAGLTIGVISFYAAQVQEILKAMVTHGLAEPDPDSGELHIAPQWRTLERADGAQMERLRVGTVDAFQGMEFDVVLLSIVRCNAHPTGSPEALRRKYGHLILPNRLCVAMSRQKRLLIAVGDGAMFEGEGVEDAVPGLTRFRQLTRGDDGLLT